MADNAPTRISLWRAVVLCMFGIFAPEKLAAAEEKDNETRRNYSEHNVRIPRAYVVRRAFWVSLLLVAGSVLAGYLIAFLTVMLCGNPPPCIITLFQILGASLLLWGTLFVRGWDIQSFAGVTLTERVNQWIYRFLYCAGTAVVVWSIVSVSQ